MYFLMKRKMKLTFRHIETQKKEKYKFLFSGIINIYYIPTGLSTLSTLSLLIYITILQGSCYTILILEMRKLKLKRLSNFLRVTQLEKQQAGTVFILLVLLNL